MCVRSVDVNVTVECEGTAHTYTCAWEHTLHQGVVKLRSVFTTPCAACAATTTSATAIMILPAGDHSHVTAVIVQIRGRCFTSERSLWGLSAWCRSLVVLPMFTTHLAHGPAWASWFGTTVIPVRGSRQLLHNAAYRAEDGWLASGSVAYEATKKEARKKFLRTVDCVVLGYQHQFSVQVSLPSLGNRQGQSAEAF